MNRILTLLLPGSGQLLRGDLRKAATIFGTAVVTGLLTGGAGWLACGVWSVVDLGASSSPAAAGSPSHTASSSAGGSPSAGHGTSMAWVFKFSTLALCAGARIPMRLTR